MRDCIEERQLFHETGNIKHCVSSVERRVYWTWTKIIRLGESVPWA
jgi:hypothetical protein